MAHSYIDFKDRQVRLSDGFIILVFSFMIRIARAHSPGHAQLLEALREWEEILDWGPGMLNIEFRGFWETPEGTELLRDLLARTADEIASHGKVISSSALREVYDSSGVQWKDVEVPWALEALQSVAGLLNP